MSFSVMSGRQSINCQVNKSGTGLAISCYIAGICISVPDTGLLIRKHRIGGVRALLVGYRHHLLL